MSLASRLGGVVVALGLLAPLPGVAQVPGLANTEGARAIGVAVRDWLARQFGGGVDLSALALQVMPEGETYRVELGFGGSYFDNAVEIGDGAVVATVKPLEGGRWEVVNAALPPQIRAEMRQGAAFGPGGAPSVMTITIDSQQTTGTFDPSLAGPSTFVTRLGGYGTEMRSATGVQTTRIGKLVGRTEWLPTGPGRVTIQGDSTLEDYSSTQPMPDGAQVQVTIDRMGGATRIENFDMDGLGAMLRTAFEIGAAAKAQAPAPGGSKAGSGKGGSGAAKPLDKALATRLLGQVFAMMDALETDYSYENLRVDGGAAFSGSLRRMGFGLSAGAPDGKMEMKLRLALEGLESPMIPPGPWVEFIPHKLSLTPRVGGVPKEAVLALLRRAIDTEGQGIDADAMAMVAANPVALGIDDLVVDLGPLRLTGDGSLEVASADDVSGEAELRATGLDALIRRANAVPELKMAAPVLIFLKGIGRQEGSETIWHITYSDRKVMVNDTDLSDMMPSK